ncbi:hypothetical protein [Deinococcus ficus]|uniref:SnoaL-like domain-containing protein n=1 Tax=Deinococcus ficus TaxID=317577 RepID=A0A221SUZ8_9DEIO|nr:hypothetical protein [Deinococcus ficus]ASN80467.1 hypothetical protein DFI_05095 [Deinococcus ficus]
MIQEAERFIDNYVRDEYETWRTVHGVATITAAEEAIARFEQKYFADGLGSALSRPGDTPDFDVAEFAQLISTKQSRKIFCVKAVDGPTFQCVLGSAYKGNQDKFELIHFRKEGGELKIVSSYYTNFDGTFTYVGGEDLGEFLDDPCPDMESSEH